MQPPEDIRHLQQGMARGGEQAFNIVPLFLKNVIEEEQWKHCSDSQGKPFTSFEAFITHQLWEGLESTIDDLKVFCRKRDDVRQLIDAAVGAAPAWGEIGGGHSRGDIVTSDRRGNSPTYLLKRLKRDRPDLADKVVRGELSAHAAAVEAGFRKKPTPLAQLRQAWAKASPDQREAFLSEVA